MLPRGPIRLSEDDCDIVLLGLERLLAHWMDHPESARLAGVDLARVQDVCAAIADRGLEIPKVAAAEFCDLEEGHGGTNN